MKQLLEVFLQQLDTDGKILERLPRRIVWLSGAPAAGKGTHTRKLMEYFHLYPEPLITSSLFQTPEMRAKINQGILLDDETVIRAVFQELQNPRYQSGVLVDGFPRKEGQAYSIEWLYQAMQKRGWKPQFLSILLLVNEETSVARQLGRAKHAQAYNERVQKTGIGTLQEVRATDLDPAIAHRRYQTFMQETYASIQILKGKIPFITIDANGALEVVTQQLRQELRKMKDFRR